MKGTNLGELEEMTLLVVASIFDEAYGVKVQEELELKCNRSISISTVHNVLARLKDKGYLSSRYDGATEERGGRRKHLYRVTKAGKKAIEQVKNIRESLWNNISNLAFEHDQ